MLLGYCFAAVHAGDQSSGQLIILFALYTHLFSLNAPKSSLSAFPGVGGRRGLLGRQWVILATLDRAGPSGSLAVIMALASRYEHQSPG